MKIMINTYIAVSLLIKTISIIALAMIIISCGGTEENRRYEKECSTELQYKGSQSAYGFLQLEYQAKNQGKGCKALLWESSQDLQVEILDGTYGAYKETYILDINGEEKYYTGEHIKTPIISNIRSINVLLIEPDDDHNQILYRRRLVLKQYEE